ncbi:helix-turn-helix transcriptional regulator [Streptomonospora nanhaiensis]|uniref:helix-turn-helix transcriptional regulator n=1 Tax=Streptomonospora nanhaiensis TaxID=1323731 RepID=UPI001C392583|nr:HTH domain-containing protein [Streptomonospora nanhaiensis]
MDGEGGGQRGTAERVLVLLGLLQRRRVWSGPELAERLGVTPRTVRRDVERLRALAKLDQVLPARLRAQVRALSDAVEPFGAGPPVDAEALMVLARACREEVEAGFDYPSGGRVGPRRVEPYRLVPSDRRWCGSAPPVRRRRCGRPWRPGRCSPR